MLEVLPRRVDMIGDERAATARPFAASKM